MAVQLDPSGKDDKNEIKTHFVTREGVYRILNLSSEFEFVRPRPGVGYQSNQSSPQVRVSLVSLPATGGNAATTSNLGSAAVAPIAATSNSSLSNGSQEASSSTSLSNGGQDRICFNIGKELYVYSFKGIRKVSLLNPLRFFSQLHHSLGAPHV